MISQTIKQFHLIGISVRTTNENGQSAKDIPALWAEFMSKGMAALITDRVDDTLYCVYTDYEKDHTRPYTTLLGCRVKSLDNVPPGTTGITINAGVYTKLTAKGNLSEGIVFSAWTRIWNSDLPRAYTADFEVYDERAQDAENAEVDIFLSVL